MLLCDYRSGNIVLLNSPEKTEAADYYRAPSKLNLKRLSAVQFFDTDADAKTTGIGKKFYFEKKFHHICMFCFHRCATGCIKLSKLTTQ